MARKWSNFNVPGALHFVTGNCISRDWWWPEDAEKLANAVKELGWYSYWKRKEEG